MPLHSRLATILCSGLFLVGCSDIPVDSSDDGIAMALGASSATRPQGGTVSFTLTVMREGGYGGQLAFVAAGAPAGVTATFDDVVTANGATTARVTLLVGATTAAASHQIQITATGEGVDNAIASFTLTVTGPGGTTAVSFADCDPAVRPLWFAWQDGTGDWTTLSPVNAVYSFAVTASRGGYAWVTPAAGLAYTVRVRYHTGAELAHQTIAVCQPGSGAPRTYHGTVSGLPAGEFATVGIGGAGIAVSSSAPTFQLGLVPPGAGDLLAFRYPSSAGNTPPSRGLLRRDVDLVNGGSLGALHFDGSESFVPALAQWNTLNASGATAAYFQLASESRCTFTPLPATAATLYGIPTTRRRPDDLHVLEVVDQHGDFYRSVKESYRVFGNRSVLFGPHLGMPQVTSLPAPYLRLQAVFTIPPEYLRSATWLMIGSSPDRFAQVVASFGWLGGTTATLAMPDLSVASGWNSGWMPGTGSTPSWALSVSGGTIDEEQCHDGALTRFALVQGP